MKGLDCSLSGIENKAKAIKQLIDGDVTPQCPASVLQFHTDVTLMLDKGAASLL